MTITFIGHGYVGLVTAAVFADLGNTVWVIGHTEEKINNLKKGIIPIYEPGLSEVVQRNVNAGRLLFTLAYDQAIPASKVIFIAVGTPPKESGEADLSVVFEVAEKLGKHLDGYTAVVTKSTVPVGTYKKTREIIEKVKPQKSEFDLASVPEFLREGQAISDTLHPDRIVIGTTSQKAQDLLIELHEPIDGNYVLSNIETAEMIKYAANAFLATKISFSNAIAKLSELSNADGLRVLEGIGLDKRIGNQFLSPGAGYGGSCFEGNETVFALNSPNIAASRFDSLFEKNGKASFGDSVEYLIPTDKRVLAFDLETKKPTLAHITAMSRRSYKGTMVNIQTAMGRSFRVTADHPVILSREEGFKILPAAAIVPGDKIMALCELPAVEEVKPLNLLEFLRGTSLEKDVYITSKDRFFTKHYASFSKAIPKTLLKYPEEIKQHNRMSLRVYRYLEEKNIIAIKPDDIQLYTAKGAGAKINAYIPVDADLLRFCGYYIAEGYISKDRGRGKSVRERVGVCFNENEYEYIEDVQKILKKWGLKFITRNATHALTTIVSSRIFAWLLSDILRLGVASSDKALPRFAFNISSLLRMELLKGAFSGDGSVTFLQNGKNMMLEYGTVSSSLRDGIVFLLQTVGVIPSIRTRWMNKSTQLAYIIRVSGYSQINFLKEVFGKKNLKKIETVLSGYSRHIKQHGFVKKGSVVTLVVRNIKHESADTIVYSMETSTGTLITSSGLISHNCFPKDVKALISIAKSYGYDFSLLKDVDKVNQDAMDDIVKKAKNLLGEKIDGATVAILGLSFKPNTDDMRDAPSIPIINDLKKLGAKIKAYDPVAMQNAKKIFSGIEFCEDSYSAAKDADLLIVVTEWNEFKQLDLSKIKAVMRKPVILDGRNIYNPGEVERLDFTYQGVGR